MSIQFDYSKQLYDDTIDQFRDKKRIKDLLDVIAKQLQEVSDFYCQLKYERCLSEAVGKQLDGLGDILCLNRIEAGLLTKKPSEIIVMEDEKYRKYLYYKVLKNNTKTVYKEIIKGLSYFWDKPIYYRETPFTESDHYHIEEYREFFRKEKGREPIDDNEAIEYWYERHPKYIIPINTIIKDYGYQPATMIFETDILKDDEDTSPLFEIPFLRAAGVTLRVYAITEKEIPPTKIHVIGGIGYPMTSSQIPSKEMEYNFESKVYIPKLGCFLTRSDSAIKNVSILTTELPSL